MSITISGGPLFSDGELSVALQSQYKLIGKEVAQYDNNRLLNTATDDLIKYFVEKYTVPSISLGTDGINVSQSETKIDVRGDSSRDIFHSRDPILVPGSSVTFNIPFSGDANLFKLTPSTFTFNPPRGDVAGSILRVVFVSTEGEDSAQLKNKFDSELVSITNYVGWIDKQIAAHNAGLENIARLEIERRKKYILDSQHLVAGLGFPLTERNDAPRTYATPEVRKKVTPLPPPASTTPYAPEPTLSMEQYEHILGIMRSMTHVMERSPSAFRTMAEPDIRQHFLVQLNGHYEGKASGETFNFEGKTDILIRDKDRNIFIAECKFWKGPASLAAAIDQILGYVSWRDTKTAILLFNRGKSFSDVLGKIPDTIKNHANYKRDYKALGESDFRAILKHRDDPNRELTLTVMAYEVPE